MRPERALAAAAALLAVGSAALLQVRRDVRDEVAALAAASDTAQRATADARLQQDVDRIRLQLERARVRPSRGTEPHLAIAITDGQLTLERGDVVLRTVHADVALGRGVRTIAQVTGDAIVLDDGTRIESSATARDTAGTQAGAPGRRGALVTPADFAAVAPNVRAGLAVYVF